jgi:hypothetical protein
MKTSTKKQPVMAARDDAGWREFPEFEELLSSEAPAPLLAKVEKTCRQLNELLQSGSEADRTRAKQAITAYGRSLDLLRLLADMRDRSGQQK